MLRVCSSTAERAVHCECLQDGGLQFVAVGSKVLGRMQQHMCRAVGPLHARTLFKRKTK